MLSLKSSLLTRSQESQSTQNSQRNAAEATRRAQSHDAAPAEATDAVLASNAALARATTPTVPTVVRLTLRTTVSSSEKSQHASSGDGRETARENVDTDTPLDSQLQRARFLLHVPTVATTHATTPAEVLFSAATSPVSGTGGALSRSPSRGNALEHLQSPLVSNERARAVLPALKADECDVAPAGNEDESDSSSSVLFRLIPVAKLDDDDATQPLPDADDAVSTVDSQVTQKLTVTMIAL
jgi:hypothetical protein